MSVMALTILLVRERNYTPSIRRTRAVEGWPGMRFCRVSVHLPPTKLLKSRQAAHQACFARYCNIKTTLDLNMQDDRDEK